jgi:hypothetical protein
MMKNIIAVDFETYYDNEISIQTLGVKEYAKQTDIYLVSFFGGDEQTTYVGHPKSAPWRLLNGKCVVSHNASFDRAVYLALVAKGVAPSIEPQSWECTANMSVYFNAGRSLKSAVKNLLGEEVSKDVRKHMKGKTREKMLYCPPLDPNIGSNFLAEVEAYALKDAQLCYQLAVEYLDKWPTVERALSEHTINICYEGLPVDTEGLTRDKQVLELLIFNAKNLLPWWEGGSDKALSTKALATQCREVGIEPPKSMAKDSDDCRDWENKYSQTYPWVGAMRTVRRANRLLTGIDTILARTDESGRFNFGLKYFGAHTGRWSGDAGFNVQNFSKEPYEGVDLRRRIKAPEGKKIVTIDLAQIEARCTVALAGDEKTLDLIRQGISVYEAHARVSMGYSDPAPLKKKDPAKYFLAKCRVLALGFQCSHTRFADFCRKYGYDMQEEEAKAIVSDYRQNNPKIVRLWAELEEYFKSSAGGTFELELPSSRVLRFYDIKQVPSKKENIPIQYGARLELGGPHFPMYGGLLTENLCQATARDIFSEAVLRLEQAGYDVLWHVHDEVSLLVDQDVNVKVLEQIFITPPEWMPNLPIGCESQEGPYYMK